MKIVTINILSDLTYWKARRSLLVRDLRELNPDIVAIQEARIPEKTAEWLADELEYPHLFIAPKLGQGREKEAIVILSRLPFKSTDWLDLQSQDRVAQYVVVEVDGVDVVVVNGHYYWGSDEEIRLSQMESMLKWIREENVSGPLVTCGDFNALPESPTIGRVLEEMESAHVIVHEEEPEYTCPTPIKYLHLLRSLREFWHSFTRTLRFKSLRGTLDYIFVNNYIKVKDCQVVLNTPAEYNWRLYPSDHFGLFAEFEVVKDE